MIHQGALAIPDPNEDRSTAECRCSTMVAFAADPSVLCAALRGSVSPTDGQQTINGMITTSGDHAIYLGLLVGVAGFEPAASSSRTERAHVHWRWSQMYPQVSSLDWDAITAYGRAWQRISAPNSLPGSDIAQPRRRAARDTAAGRARTRP